MRKAQKQAGPRLWVGTSGWVYDHWIGKLYPPEMKPARWLAHYAQHFPTVEINFTFYRLPERATFEQWRDQTPPGFLFAVKASRYLTHLKRLNDPEEPLDRLLDRATGLGDKLGPILFQLPHTYHLRLDKLDPFLEALGRHPGHRYVFEFRHDSWLVPEVYSRLERVGAALCVPVGPGVPFEVRATAPFSYVRMHAGEHGTGYTPREIATWTRHVEDLQRQTEEVFVYFNNDTGGHALVDAARFLVKFGMGEKLRKAG